MGNETRTLLRVTEQSLRELKKLTTARELATSAFALARERDLDAVTIDDIVDRVGYSRRTFANHFSCKQEAVVDGFFLTIEVPVGRYVQDVGTPDGPVSADDALAGAQEYITSLLTGRDLVVVQDFLRLVRTQRSLEPYLAQSLFDLHSRLRGILVDAGTASGKASLLFGAVLGVTGVVVEEFLQPRSCADHGDPAAPSAPAVPAVPDEAALRARLDEAFTYLRRGFSDEPSTLTAPH